MSLLVSLPEHKPWACQLRTGSSGKAPYSFLTRNTQKVQLPTSEGCDDRGTEQT